MTNKSLSEANQEKSQQKNQTGNLKSKKGADQPESQKIGEVTQAGSAGWEEQLWMDQADNSALENDTTWQAEEKPIFNEAKAQVGKIFGQMENGLYSLLNSDRATLPKGAWLEGQNSQEIKRWSSLIGGGLLALFGLRRSLGSLALMGIGGGLVYYALTGKWLLPTGTTQTGHTGALSLDSKRPITVKNMIVKAPLPEVYAAWANFENFPHFMQHIRAVTKTGERSSHWIMDGPLHSRLEWDAETTRLEENKRIAWSSTQGDIKTSGQVTFNALPNEEVEVTVMLRYIPPAGIVGDLFATLFSDPEGKLTEDLRNFKRYIEKSESVATAA
jgi:uncharacterized membrane protein